MISSEDRTLQVDIYSFNGTGHWRVVYDRSGEVIRVTDEQARHFFEAGREYERNPR